jgi:oligopeptide/dipeptide ABC transporter ATP-binding protein
MTKTMAAATDTLLEIRDLVVAYRDEQAAFFSRRRSSLRAVNGVSFSIRRGETFAIVGESGCGKSSTALAALRMIRPDSGHIVFDGRDVGQMRGAALRSFRRRIQAVFQDPVSSLNPRMKVADIIAEPLVIHGIGDSRSQKARVADLLNLVGLAPDMSERFPHEFSGGQRQRISIARALALEPELVVCDEAVSALDVSVQAQILNLLLDLQRRLGLAYLFISHDLSVVRHISDRVAVMYLGRIVEMGDAAQVFSDPRHPYTQALLASAPDVASGDIEGPQVLPGEPPSPRAPPSGCAFHPRCRFAISACRAEPPRDVEVGDGHFAACRLLTSESPG